MAFQQGLLTSNLVWRNGQADTVQQDGYEALLRALVTFAADKAALSVSYSGTGNGQIDYLDGGVGAPTETWTIAFTAPTTFTVTGSVSGAQAGGSTGSLYTTTGNPITSLLSFQIDVGGTAFIATDTFTVTATAGTIAAADTWVLDRWNPDDLYTIANALIWHGEGDGSEAIHAGLRLTETPASQIWNWVMRGYTGFSGSQDFENQPGANDDDIFTAFWNNDMTYWFSVNARRYIVAAKVSTTYHTLYHGLFLPFGSPTEYPFPMAVLGEKDDEEAWNSTDTSFHCFIETCLNGQVRDVAGTWLNMQNTSTSGNIWMAPNQTAFPGSGGSVWDNHENYGAAADHQLLPLMLGNGPTGGATQPLTMEPFGVLDGANTVTGTNQSVETVLSISGTNWIVLQDIFRNQRDNFWAMEMA